jgi:hypothetical protein
MEPHQQRVIDERRDLDDKLSKLNAFMSENAIFDGLPEEDRRLMRLQGHAMAQYSGILAARIERFP